MKVKIVGRWAPPCVIVPEDSEKPGLEENRCPKCGKPTPSPAADYRSISGEWCVCYTYTSKEA
jgi:hypothetical protein